MKIVFLSLLISVSTWASQCPTLSGKFDCGFATITIDQKLLDPGNERTLYFLYWDEELTPNHIRVSPAGEIDSYGNITTCIQQQIVFKEEEVMMKLYLDQNLDLIHEVVGGKPWQCSRID